MPISPAIQSIIDNGNRLFSARQSLLSYWQELAEFFYFERADFTMQHSIGEDYAAGTFTSRPALYRREMGDMYRPMMRPADFFEVQTLDEELNKQSDARGWLEFATDFMRKVMYRKEGGFTKSTVATDHDHVTFGQGVIEACATPDRSGVYYRNWHLRDVAWSEDYAGNVDDIHRNASQTLSQLVGKFGEKVPTALRNDSRQTPHKPIKARHVVVRSDAYDFDFRIRENQPWVSLWVLPDHETVLETVPRSYRGYVIPRGPLVSGSQYAQSMLTSIVLPDARSLNAIQRILLEAGEKAVDPPMLAKMDVIRSDMGLYAGGYTWVDSEYDERLGEALRPINSDHSGLPFGVDLAQAFELSIRDGLKTAQIQLPDTANMTAYQVRQIIQQQMRAHIPLFDPIEVEYNEPLCSETFLIMRSLGAFPASELPPVLRGVDIEFSFKTPIKDLEADSKRQMLAEGMEVIGAAGGLDPDVAKIAKPMEITRDTLRGIGWPEEWLNDERAVAMAIQKLQEQQQAEMAAQTAMGAAEGAGKAAPMVKALVEAGRAA